MRSQDSTVSTVPSCRLDHCGIALWFLMEVRGSSLLQSFQTSSWVHPASHSEGTGAFLPVDKAFLGMNLWSHTST